MTRLTAIVEMMGIDRNSLRESCEEFCNRELTGEPVVHEADQLQGIADACLRKFLTEVAPTTSGLSQLSVSVMVTE